MKRRNVVLDDKLLEDVRRESGERTYSGAIMKAMREFLRVRRLTRALDELEEMAAEAPLFDPEYVASTWPAESRPKQKRRVSAHIKRAPVRNGRSRSR